METISFDNKTYHLTWFAEDTPPDANVTQVSGYVFNQEGELLIVKVGKNWTIPGGHPEANEAPLETLTREVIEEACVKIKAPKFLGHVKVVPEHDESVHYQLRYKAIVENIDDFHQSHESGERKFVPVDQLKDHIKWFNSVIFQLELKAAIAA